MALNFQNPNSYFSPETTYAGSLPMAQALRQYFSELMGPQAGGQAQLAAGQAAEAPAAQYQKAMATGAPQGGPAQTFGAGNFGALMGGLEGSRNAGRQVGSGVKMDALQGVENVGNAYAGDITSNIQAQLAMERAKAQQVALEQQQIMGLTSGALSLAGGISTGTWAGGLGGGATALDKGAGAVGTQDPMDRSPLGPQSSMTESNIGSSASPFASLMNDPNWLALMAQYGNSPMVGYGGY